MKSVGAKGAKSFGNTDHSCSNNFHICCVAQDKEEDREKGQKAVNKSDEGGIDIPPSLWLHAKFI
jgi:hypothetical protein